MLSEQPGPVQPGQGGCCLAPGWLGQLAPFLQVAASWPVTSLATWGPGLWIWVSGYRNGPGPGSPEPFWAEAPAVSSHPRGGSGPAVTWTALGGPWRCQPSPPGSLPSQAQPTDMRALQDVEEPEKLHIQMNDVITVIEGRYRLESPGVAPRRPPCLPHQLLSAPPSLGRLHGQRLPPPPPAPISPLPSMR